MKNLNELEKLEKKLPKGAFSTFDLAILIPEIKKLGEDDIYVEIGVDKGKSFTAAMLTAKSKVKLYGIDVLHQHNVDVGLKNNTMFIHNSSYEVARTWNKGGVSLIHIDGDHSYIGCGLDIHMWYPLMRKDGVMLFHDCDESSPGVMQAVSQFVNEHKVKKFELFKRTDRNTSMAKIQL